MYIFRTSNYTPFHHCEVLPSFNAHDCQALKSGYRFHNVIVNLSHPSIVVFLEVGSSVYEDFDFFNVILSSKYHSFSGANSSRMLQGLICLRSVMKVSCRLLSSKSDFFFLKRKMKGRSISHLQNQSCKIVEPSALGHDCTTLSSAEPHPMISTITRTELVTLPKMSRMTRWKASWSTDVAMRGRQANACAWAPRVL